MRPGQSKQCGGAKVYRFPDIKCIPSSGLYRKQPPAEEGAARGLRVRESGMGVTTGLNRAIRCELAGLPSLPIGHEMAVHRLPVALR